MAKGSSAGLLACLLDGVSVETGLDREGEVGANGSHPYSYRLLGLTVHRP